MSPPQHMQRGGVTSLALAVFYLSMTAHVSALEPPGAMDDGFAVPAPGTMVEAVLSYPGAETFLSGVWACGGWSVPFGVDELAVTTGFAGVSGKRFGASVSYSGSGFDLYGDEMEKIGVSFAPLASVSGGLRLTRSAMRIRGYGHASAWSADAGIVLRPAKAVFLACAFEDLADAELGESKEPLDGRLRFSGSWSVSDRARLLVSVVKVRRFEPSVSAGFAIDIARVLTLGAAGANKPGRFEFLAGVRAKKATFSYRSSYHRELGMTHGFSIAWRSRTAQE